MSFQNAFPSFSHPCGIVGVDGEERLAMLDEFTDFMMDDDADSVPRGTFRFYHDDAGFHAATDFEITKNAIRQKLVTKLAVSRASDGQVAAAK